MGQKVNPHGARVGVILDWSTKWYAGKKDFSNFLVEDYNLRKMLKEKLMMAGVSHIDIQRTNTKIHVSIYTAKPGIVIGKGGAGAEAVKNDIAKMTGKPVTAIQLDIMEIKHPDTNAQLVAENIAQQLEKRISFRRAMKQSLARAMSAGAKGIKTHVSGRLGGADIARGPKDTMRVRSRCRPCARTSITALPKPDHLRPHRRQGVDLQRSGASPRPPRRPPGRKRRREGK